MYNLIELLNDMMNSTGIRFNVVSEDGVIIFEGLTCEAEKISVSVPVSLGNECVHIYLTKEHEGCASIIKYAIESKYRESLSEAQEVIYNILEGRNVPADKIERNLSFIKDGCYLILVSVDVDRKGALSLINEAYSGQNVLSLIYGEYILILGAFDEVSEHASSIRESMLSNAYRKCSVSYGDVFFDINGMRKAYKDAEECILLSRRLKIKDDAFTYSHMLFEKIVYNMNSEIKEELISRFESKFNAFDNEIINTIERFIENDLNISETAKKLYVHRNTLIYRLDKIYKETGSDIRNFKEAVVFIIAFLVWKEKQGQF
jgi:DNA-binding PucR family transcriptional regulator